VDWAHTFVAALPARAAVATAVARLVPGPGPRIGTRPGGWSVTAPTGRQTACGGLTELIAATLPWLGPPSELDPHRASGRLVVPPPDTRQPVRIRLDPAAPGPGAEADTGIGTGTGTDSGSGTEPGGILLVRDARAARAMVRRLAGVPWALRHVLAEVDGVAGVDVPWASRPTEIATRAEEQAADVVVHVEHARQAGAWDDRAIAVRAPLGPGTELDVEVRAGHVVRARARPTGRRG
jgi:hypothetical protein